METKTFNLRLGNLEARRSSQGYEIVQWGESSCWVLAYWTDPNRDGFFLKFAGNRPFGDKVDPKDFWALARMGQTLLDYGLERLE